MALACLLILAVLLLIGAAIDIKSRRIPNWLTAGVAGLYALYVMIAPVPVDWLGASAVAGAS
ncbi:MAG: prepilin peptidase, partial [Geminicoccaceae bacterium]